MTINLLEAGKVVPVIDRRYPLREVPEAIRYLKEGHARAKSSSRCNSRSSPGRESVQKSKKDQVEK